MFHPDERNIANSITQLSFFKQMDPHFFAYGGFSIYLYKIIGDFSNLIGGTKIWVYDWGHIDLISRFISALASSVSILLLFFLGKRLFGKEVGLLSAIFGAFTVSFIQTAHFGVTESLLGLWILILTILAFNFLKKPKFSTLFLLGVVSGISVGTKTTALSFLIIPFFAWLFSNRKPLSWLFGFILVSFITFTVVSPYTFLSWNKFIESMNYETGVATGKLMVPYTLQFNHTQPYLFQIKNFIWQTGLVFIFGIPGILYILYKGIKEKNKFWLSVFCFPLIYFFYVGFWYTKFLRFMVPILPFIILAAAFLLWEIKKRRNLLGSYLIAFMVISTILWSIAFFSIYTREQTRIAASNWIYNNIPENSVILGEHWDDGLPIPIQPFSPNLYQISALTIYEPDNQEKINYYAQNLSTGDYIVINSRRLYGTLMYLPEKYPITSKYYKLLFEGKLGYKKVAEFASYPQIFGLQINDDSSEETFQVYDHPKVMIFKNKNRFGFEQLKGILQ